MGNIQFKIKDEHAEKYVAFAGGKRGRILLKDRSQEDLAKLALIAQDSQNPDLLDLFEGELPSVTDLKAAQVKNEVNKLDSTQVAKEIEASTSNTTKAETKPASSNTPAK